MPDTTISEALAEAFTVAPKGVVYLATLEIIQEGQTTVYLVRDLVDHDFTLENSDVVTFTGCGFRFALPATGDNGIQDLSIAIDNTDRRITEFLEKAEEYDKPVTIKYRAYLSTDPTFPQNNPPLTLNLTDIVVDVKQVQGKCTFFDLLNKVWPNTFYNRENFPGLANG